MLDFTFGVFVIFVCLVLVLLAQGISYFKKNNDSESYRRALKGFGFSAVTVSFVSAILFFISGEMSNHIPTELAVIKISRGYLDENFGSCEWKIKCIDKKVTAKEGYFLLSYYAENRKGKLKVMYQNYSKNKELTIDLVGEE